jgi:hypothetical protein
VAFLGNFAYRAARFRDENMVDSPDGISEAFSSAYGTGGVRGVGHGGHADGLAVPGEDKQC